MGDETKTKEATLTPSIEKDGLRSVSDLLKDAWMIFAAGWTKFLLYFLLTLVAIITTIAVITLLVLATTATNSAIAITVAIIIGILLAVVIFSVFTLASNKLVYSIAEKNGEGIKAALLYGYKNFGTYILVMLASAILIIVGLVLLFIPGIIVGVFLSLVAPVFILEGNHKLNALKRSRELVRGHFWPVFGRLFLLSLISGAISLIVQIDPKMTTLTLFLGIIATIANFILTYYGIAYVYLIYKDLAEIKKATHLN